MRTDLSKHWGEGTWISRKCSSALEQMEKYLREQVSELDTAPETWRKGQRESADKRETCQRTH